MVKKDLREYFPGYNEGFDIHLEKNQVLRCKVTSAKKGTVAGDKTAGNYIKSVTRRELQDWYRNNLVQTGDTLIFEIIEHHKKYKMTFKRQEN